MYYPYFVIYITVGLAVSLGVFFWALKHGQFTEQQRARFLALGNEEEGAVRRVTPFNRYEGVVLFLLALAGLSITAAVLIHAILISG